VHLLVDSIGLKLCGAGERLVEIVAAALTTNDVDDACQTGLLLDQVTGPVASFTADGAYDQDSVYRTVVDRDPDAAVIVPPRSTATPSETAETQPTQRDRDLQCIAERGGIGWQKVSGYDKRSRLEGTIGRYKQVIGDGLRFRKDKRHHRGCRRRACHEPHVGTGSPDFRPPRMNSDGAEGCSCDPFVDPCNNSPWGIGCILGKITGSSARSCRLQATEG
jgi:hypothetical protein